MSVLNLASYLDKWAKVGIDKAACRCERKTGQLRKEEEMEGRTCQQIPWGQDTQQFIHQLSRWKRNIHIGYQCSLQSEYHLLDNLFYLQTLKHIYTCTSVAKTHVVNWMDPWRVWRNIDPCIFGHNLSPTSPSCSQLGFGDKVQWVCKGCPHPESIHSCTFSSSAVLCPA